MPRVVDIYRPPADLVLGSRLNQRLPEADQKRQRAEVVEILNRLRHQPGVILADEVGMGKTFAALAVAYSVAARNPRGPVVIMVPANLVDKWEQDLQSFCELYLENRSPVRRDASTRKAFLDRTALRYGVARHSVELMKLLDDPPRERCHLIFVAQGAMARQQTDKWIRLALIAEALRRHGRGGANRLIQVKNQIHRFLGQLLWAKGEERAHGWGEDLWRRLLRTDPESWKDIYNEGVGEEQRRLSDDPVPKAVLRAVRRADLKSLAEALRQMPVRAARGDDDRLSERLNAARTALRAVEERLWRSLLAQAAWRSPLLVMDEAHHLKNPGTSLARQLQSPDLDQDLRTGDGALARAFDRMLFLTATPFQLGHAELVRVLERFGDVRWDDGELGDRDAFKARLADLGKHLTDSQRAAIALQRSWSRLRAEDGPGDGNLEEWWSGLRQAPRESLTHHQRAVVEAFEAAKRGRDAAEDSLRPWVVRHNKGAFWANAPIARRERLVGAAAAGQPEPGGLPIPSDQLLPFFLAARSAVSPDRDLLGEALSSSYEAFRYTRQERAALKDEQETPSTPPPTPDLAHAEWYLGEFDRALEHCSGSAHPKIAATVRKVADLWDAGEKVLVFAFYRHTCRALRLHISREIERRMVKAAMIRLGDAGSATDPGAIERLLERVQRRFFDDADSPGRRAVDDALDGIVSARADVLEEAHIPDDQRSQLKDVMRRFLRVSTTLARCFPLAGLDSLAPAEAVAQMLDHLDASGVSWRHKFDGFIEFLAKHCGSMERSLYLEAAEDTKTGGIRVEDREEADGEKPSSVVTLANVQAATGETDRDQRARLMRSFNTPFFPDILVCSEVMSEGVDLQRFCRHVVHHDLAWNPSDIEQRTGRVDRIGCKAEGRHPIVLYLPYLAGTADERQYRVMSDREQWFRVVMGEDAVARLIAPDSSIATPLPAAIGEELGFKLNIAPIGSDAISQRVAPPPPAG